MLIYRITNLINGKSYIGQTIYDKFNKRYSGGRWWDTTDNILLMNSAKKYGKENFSVEILEENVSSLEILNKLEEFYAEKYNTYKPHGYNLRYCGDNRKLLPHQIEIIRNHASRTYKLRKVDTWEEIEVTNLREFCRQNGLREKALYSLVNKHNGIIVSHGFCLASRTKTEVQNRKCTTFRSFSVNLIDKNGKEIFVEDARDFARKNNLEKNSFNRLLNGKMLHYKGFRLSERKDENPKNIKEVELCYEFGEKVKVCNIQKFCKEKSLRYRSVLRVIGGKRKIHRGWHLPSTSEEEIFMINKPAKIKTHLLDQEGKDVFVENLAYFCYLNKLNFNSFYLLHKGVISSTNGWTTPKNKHLYLEFISPNGEVHKSIGFKRICEKFDLNMKCLSNILNPKSKSNFHRGWTVRRQSA